MEHLLNFLNINLRAIFSFSRDAAFELMSKFSFAVDDSMKGNNTNVHVVSINAGTHMNQANRLKSFKFWSQETLSICGFFNQPKNDF